jgi:hypothetical protein
MGNKTSATAKIIESASTNMTQSCGPVVQGIDQTLNCNVIVDNCDGIDYNCINNATQGYSCTAEGAIEAIQKAVADASTSTKGLNFAFGNDTGSESTIDSSIANYITQKCFAEEGVAQVLNGELNCKNSTDATFSFMNEADQNAKCALVAAAKTIQDATAKSKTSVVGITVGAIVGVLVLVAIIVVIVKFVPPALAKSRARKRITTTTTTYTPMQTQPQMQQQVSGPVYQQQPSPLQMQMPMQQPLQQPQPQLQPQYQAPAPAQASAPALQSQPQYQQIPTASPSAPSAQPAPPVYYAQPQPQAPIPGPYYSSMYAPPVYGNPYAGGYAGGYPVYPGYGGAYGGGRRSRSSIFTRGSELLRPHHYSTSRRRL